MKRVKIVIALSLFLVSLMACEREERGFRVSPPEANRINSIQLTSLKPGEESAPPPIKNEYEENAFALFQGKQLFSQMNCVGCHAHGGGGMGPALMDEKWIYGGKPEEIFSTIVAGRPNGMPSFRGRVPDFQIWQLAAYVRSMSGQLRKDAAPTRDDHLQGRPPESMTKQKSD